MFLLQILIGLSLVVVGTVALVFNRQLFNFTGSIGSVERRFPGGSSGFIKLVAVLMVLVGLMIATGVINWLIAPITDYFNGIFHSSR